MPKVTEAYFHKKKTLILDVAYKLCLEKTVSNVTIKDITKEAGLSVGGIYRFYKNIDVLLADMIDRIRIESNMKHDLDAILAKIEEKSYKELVYDVFELLGQEMENRLMGSEKIDFELNILAMNEPDRVAAILRNTKVGGNKEYLNQKTAQLFMKAEQEGKLKFLIPVNELMTYIAATYSGIQMTCIVNRCYHKMKDKDDVTGNPVKQMHFLACSVLSFIEE